MKAFENITRDDLIRFGKQIKNVDNSNPVLWYDIISDGNCFFHALYYAITNNLSPKNLNKILLNMRKKYARLVIENEVYYDKYFDNVLLPKKDKIIDDILTNRHSIYRSRYKISEQLPPTFIQSMNGSWKYSETDIIRAAAVELRKVIIIISMNKFGGITIILPNNLEITKDNVVFLICMHTIHYVPFKFNPNNPELKVTISKKMLKKLKSLPLKLETTVYDNRSSVLYCTSNELFDSNNKGKNKNRSIPKLKKHLKNVSIKLKKNIEKQIETNAKYARDIQIQNNAEFAKQLQLQNNAEFAKQLQIQNNAEYARYLQNH